MHTMGITVSVDWGSQFGMLVLGSLVVVMESMDFPLVVAMETLERELERLEVAPVPQVEELALVGLVEAPELVEALVVLASVLAEHC